MVRSWGMSELGPLSYSKDDDQVFLGREIAHSRDYSEDTARRIDEAVTNIISSSYKKAEEVLKENMNLLHKLAELLLEKETVMGSELDELILSEKPGFKFSSTVPSLEDQEPVLNEQKTDTEDQEESFEPMENGDEPDKDQE
jgi:cell division protease FtsH